MVPNMRWVTLEITEVINSDRPSNLILQEGLHDAAR